MKGIYRSLVLLMVGLLLLAACGQTQSGASGNLGPIKVASKDFTEEYILAEMYALLLEDAGFKVERKLNLGGTPIVHEAIKKGDVDLYPEYTSTGLLTVLKKEPITDARAIFDTVKKEYEQQFQLTWLEPAPFNNTQALAMTKESAQKLGIQTYSDLAMKAPELILGGPPEFLEREDGIKGLQEVYGGFEFKEAQQLGASSNLRYEALKNGLIDVVVAFGTDGQIKGLDLALLQDDKTFYPIYQAAPVIRMDVLQRYPQISEILNKLAPKLTDDIMSGLNWQVDGPEKKEPIDVARTFLQSQGLLKK